MEKIKIFYDDVSKVEIMANTWLESNNIIIKNIKTRMNGYYLVLVILYEEDKVNPTNIYDFYPKPIQCIYEPDNTTAMNCKWCGKSKWQHMSYDTPMHYPSDVD